MRPGSKLQVEIMDASNKLPKISENQKQWAIDKVLEHKAYKLKSGRIGCLDCGHIWEEKKDIKKIDCPSCGTQLKVETTKALKFEQKKWIGVIDTHDRFQLNRYWEVSSRQKVGEKAEYYFYEIIQQWIIPEGKWEFVARNRGGSYYYTANYFTGDMQLRHRELTNKYCINPWAIYPIIDVQPIYKRNGFKNSFHEADPFNLLKNLLKNPRIETLLKAKQYSLMRYVLYNGERYWNSMKICIRNNYTIKNAKLWVDYLELLNYFKKDLNNAKFVCPKSIRKEHDILVAKKQAIIRAQDAERARQQEEERLIKRQEKEKSNEPDYFRNRFGEMMDLKFTLKMKEGLLEIIPLQDIDDFKTEGEVLNHCIHTNDYFLKPNSFCFSAKVRGERTESIEFNLKTMEVVECYGRHNKFTEYHDRILKLMKKNVSKIAKAWKENKERKENFNQLTEESKAA